MKKFYITTTLPYANAVPHIGHALEFFQADVIARYQRRKLGSDNVFFNLGLDEHGLKNYRKSIDQGLTPQEGVDLYAGKWKKFCKDNYISYDSFYRTTDPTHKKLAQKLWLECDKNGDIYKKKYSGLYCVGCESFKTEKDLIDGKCPDHNIEPEEISEENYFFRLSKYTQNILEYLDANKSFVEPSSKQHALKRFIEQGLEDISISRYKKTLPWGVDVPGDPEQVFYVWFDALTNYLFAVGFYTDEERFNELWPGVQICGPDNLRFQGAMWQGMLASLNIPFTQKLLVHGTVLGTDGRAMSKSLGNVISPFELIEKYGAEALRFYLIAGVPTYGNFALSTERIVETYNNRLADKYGNLLNRVIHLAKTNSLNIGTDVKKISTSFKKKVDKSMKKFEDEMDKYCLDKAYKVILDLTDYGNEYITKEAPWEKTKAKTVVEEILSNLLYLLEKTTDAYEPIIPVSAKKARTIVAKLEPEILFEKIEEK